MRSAGRGDARVESAGFQRVSRRPGAEDQRAVAAGDDRQAQRVAAGGEGAHQRSRVRLVVERPISGDRGARRKGNRGEGALGDRGAVLRAPRTGAPGAPTFGAQRRLGAVHPGGGHEPPAGKGDGGTASTVHASHR